MTWARCQRSRGCEAGRESSHSLVPASSTDSRPIPEPNVLTANARQSGESGGVESGVERVSLARSPGRRGHPLSM